ncbi:DUF2262 domain-containing protein [Nocardioides sp.]|jgi:hypothetical protein|uniref:DUF2262 domain-containing protein n=1 Tax=Nocardioides sp. TaxID=35761 RepID=UPI002D1054D8|nr:DUF2262 domain-containing protein [Nocardioides sp.]HVX53326.1 DUF2262 domain-containing protein [Nocardioides sp.]
MSEPVRHPLGEFVFVPGTGSVHGWFEGTLRATAAVELVVDTEDPNLARGVLDDVARERETGVLTDGSLIGRIVADLLDLANEVWLDDDEQITARQFRNSLTLMRLTVDAEGVFGAIFHDDADVFAGHGIEVIGTLAHGATKASISG